MATDEKPGEKSRRERRKEARLVKNKTKFDSWVHHQQSWKSEKSMLQLNSESVRKLPKDNAIKDCTVQPQKVEKSRSELRNLKTKKGASSENCSQQLSTTVNSEINIKDLKRKKGLSKSSISNFSQCLELEIGGRLLSAEEDLRFERKLAKKLKMKNGRLSAANDDIDTLLEGIPSVLDSIAENAKITENVENGALPGKSKKSYSVSEDSEDEISVDERNEDSDSLIASCEEHNELEEEAILPKDSNKGKRRKTKFEEYLEADMQGDRSLAEADLALERKLSKKLKVKEGNLQGDDDDINMLFEGIPSVVDTLEDVRIQNPEDYPKNSLDNRFSSKKLKTSNLIEKEQKTERRINSAIGASKQAKTSSVEVVLEKFPNMAPTKYVAPHLRSHGGITWFTRTFVIRLEWHGNGGYRAIGPDNIGRNKERSS